MMTVFNIFHIFMTLSQAADVFLYFPAVTGSRTGSIPAHLYGQGFMGASALTTPSGNGCPVERPFVSCSLSPCSSLSSARATATGNSNRPCSNYPTAVCVDDYCGGCTARFYVPRNGQGEAYPLLYWTSPNAFVEVTSQCLGSLPVQTTSALSNPTSLTVFPRYSHSGRATVEDCLPGVPITEKNCMPNRMTPCQALRCAQWPNAECVNFHCGGCLARFYQDGVDITQACALVSVAPQPHLAVLTASSSWQEPSNRKNGGVSADSPLNLPVPSEARATAQSGCGSVAGRVLLPAPTNLCNYESVCRGLDTASVCPQFPAAVCTVDPCGFNLANPLMGQCASTFMIGSTDVTSVCFPPRSHPDAGSLSIPQPVVARLCPAGQLYRIVCNYPPCGKYGPGCPGYPMARCYEDSCGGCIARYFVSSTEVTSLCYSYPVFNK